MPGAPSRVPLHVICIETSRRGETVGFRAKSVRDETVEAWRDAEETLEGGSGFPILEFWTRIGRNLLLPLDPYESHGNSPWDVPFTCCLRGARFSAPRFCTFPWKRRLSRHATIWKDFDKDFLPSVSLYKVIVALYHSFYRYLMRKIKFKLIIAS